MPAVGAPAAHCSGNLDAYVPKPPPRGQKLRSSPVRKELAAAGVARGASLEYSNPTYPLTKSPSPARYKQKQTKQTKMQTMDKKSISLSSIAKLPSDTEEGADNLVASCKRYLDENETFDSGSVTDHVKKENKRGEATIINPFIDVQMYNAKHDLEPRKKLSTVSDIRDHMEVSKYQYPNSPSTSTDNFDDSAFYSYKTLPRAFHRKQKVSKSVRDFIDRAKSSEPEFTASRREFTASGRQDGTESVSSFVALSPNDHLLKASQNTLETTSSGEGWSENDDYEDKTDSFTKKGFVNKCVTRVKSLGQRF